MLPYAAGQLGSLSFLLFASLSLLFFVSILYFPLFFLPLCYVLYVHGFNAKRSHDCSIPLPSSIGSSVVVHVEFLVL